MKVILLNGSPHKTGCTNRDLLEIQTIFNKEDIESEIVHIAAKPVTNCMACGSCKKTKNGCIFEEDLVNSTIQKLKDADGLIVGSPVYYSNSSGLVRSFLDRLFYAGSAFEGKSVFAYKPAAAIVNCRRGGASAAFEELNQYFLISNMIVVGSQYWNQTHGHVPSDVEQDLEGLQTMRTLAQNMSWLLKSINVAKENGIEKPQLEPVIRTNFI